MRTFRPWEQHEDDTLDAEWIPGAAPALAVKLNRTVTAIVIRASARGLTLRYRERFIASRIAERHGAHSTQSKNEMSLGVIVAKMPHSAQD